MQNAAVGRDSVLHHIIADKNVKVAERRTLMGHAKYPMAIAKNQRFNQYFANRVRFVKRVFQILKILSKLSIVGKIARI